MLVAVIAAAGLIWWYAVQQHRGGVLDEHAATAEEPPRCPPAARGRARRGRGDSRAASTPPAGEPAADPALRALVRRDVRLFVVSAALAVASVLALAAWGLDWLGDGVPALVLGLAAVAVGVIAYATGPPLRDRMFLLGPPFLAATPVVVGLYNELGFALAFVVSLAIGLVAVYFAVRAPRRARR